MIIKIWQGGMSFHGGLVGVLLSLWVFSAKYRMAFWYVTDTIAPYICIGLALGRLGNFINGELWGRVTTVPWGMIFPHVDGQIRHPSQLYEFFLEGVVMFSVLMWYSRKPRAYGAVSGLFALMYGVFRFGVEFFREPDPQMGLVLMDKYTMGQVLSIPMIMIGWYLFFRGRKEAPEHNKE